MDNEETQAVKVKGPRDEAEDLVINDRVEEDRRAQKAHIEALISRKGVTTRESAEQNINALHRTYKRTGFIDFLFFQFSRMNAYARRTGLLRFQLIPPGFQVNTARYRSVLSACFKDAAMLQPVLKVITEKGWRTLTKSDYNHAGLFKRFCDALVQMSADVSKDSDKFFKNLDSMQKLYLACWHKPEFTPRLISIIESVLKTFKDADETAQKARESIQRLLYNGESFTIIADLILAGDMAAGRRYISRKNMVIDNPGPVVSDFHMAAPSAVNAEILRWVKENIELLEGLAVDKTHNLQIQYLLESFRIETENLVKDYNYNPLGEVITHYDKPGAGTWQKVYDDVVQTAQHFLPAFLQSFDKFLTDKSEIAGVGAVRCFPHDYFSSEMNQVRRSLDRLTLNNFQVTNMGRKEFYAHHRKERRNTTGWGQQGMVQLLEEMAGPFQSMGVKLGTLILHHKDESVPLDRWFNKNSASLQIQQEIDHVLWGKKVLVPGFLYGKTFSECIETASRICLLYSLYYYNKEMTDFLDNSHRLDRSIKELKQSLERIADVLTWDDISRRFAAI